MIEQKHNIHKPSLKDPSALLLSMFGIGLTPKAPGTIASLVTLIMLYPLSFLKAPPLLYVPFLIILTVISTFITEMYQKRNKIHDPGWIVIDEFLGMFCTWLFVTQHTITNYIIIFILFRFFDIYKFWPASYFDKKVKHGFGTIFDDIVSAIMAGISYLFIQEFILYFNV